MVNCQKLSILVLILAMFMAGCTSARLTKYAEKDFDSRTKDALGNLTIGLLADSQLQTPKSHFGEPLMRGKLSDLVVEVALRPPALNYYSEFLLKSFLDKMANEEPKANVIFYLGDGANNGCSDEVKHLIDILEKFREETHIPIFFLPGNHDYLGAGNTPDLETRKALCSDIPGDDQLITKRQLITKLHNFNAINKKLDDIRSPAWSFRDSYDDLKLDERCGKSDEPYQHGRAGCFLAGYLKYNKVKVQETELPVEFLLLDTSDYFDKESRLHLRNKDYYGGMGWISTRKYCGFSKESCESQLNWFFDEVKRKEETQPAVRILLSHYPPHELGPFARMFSPNGGLISRLSPLFSPKPIIDNFWFTAHTHVDRPKLSGSGELYYIQQENNPAQFLNIGSTTDYEPHAVKVRLVEKANSGGGNVLLKKLVIDYPVCGEVEAYFKGKEWDRRAAGIDTSYKGLFWTTQNNDGAYQKLDQLTEELVDKFRAKPGHIKACIALLASKYEARMVEDTMEGGNIGSDH